MELTIMLHHPKPYNYKSFLRYLSAHIPLYIFCRYPGSDRVKSGHLYNSVYFSIVGNDRLAAFPIWRARFSCGRNR